MRRSRSFSNIPMPYNKRDSKIKRAKSVVREPSLDNQTPLACRLTTNTPLTHRLGFGSDQKYKLQKHQRTPITPTTYTEFKRRGGSSVSSFGSRVSLTKNRSPLEKKSIQKLINDKKWVVEQYSKVQSFIQTSELFNPDLAGMIRPPTINTFVELVSVLFRQLIKTDVINSQNYADVILTNLKLLRYPGTITLSTIKTANTMHGWPHFIAIISWLIERADLNSINNAFREQQDEDAQVLFSLQDSVFEFLTMQYSIYTDTADPEILAQSEDKLFGDMVDIIGIDYEDAQSLELSVETCRNELAALETNIEEITEENQKIQAQNLTVQNVVKQFKENPSTKEQEVEEELLQLRKVLKKQSENERMLELSVKELENIVSSQSCRYNEKAKILSQIENLKRAIARREGKLTEFRIVRDELDHELRTMVTEIEAKVDAWNVSITKTLLPELKDLKLRDKGFHSNVFIDEIREILKAKIDIEKQLIEEFKTIKLKIEKAAKRKESLAKENKAMEATRNKLDSLKSDIQSSREENKNLSLEIDETRKRNEAMVMEIEQVEGNRIKEAETETAELDERIRKLTQDIDKTAKKGLSVMVEAHNMAEKNIQRIDELMKAKQKDITRLAAKSKRELQDTFNHLSSIQEQSARMLGN